MAKKRRVPSGKTRPRRKKNIRSEVLAEPDEVQSTGFEKGGVLHERNTFLGSSERYLNILFELGYMFMKVLWYTSSILR
eukprot:677107-Amorphochlora_amoeboformis.AAC.1